MSLQLTDGDRVIIVGGGPAGCFAGLHLLALARQKAVITHKSIGIHFRLRYRAAKAAVLGGPQALCD